MKTDFTGPLATEFAGRPRRTDRPILLVGFVEQGNLTRRVGWRVVVADVDQDPESVLKVAEAERPIVIFSLIFQFYIRRYRAVIRRLRAAGIEAHITMGGHFPSLAPAATFAEVPELDSMVQYEGELTLLELADALSTGADWRAIAGIVRQQGGPPACAETRHLLSLAEARLRARDGARAPGDAAAGEPRLRTHLLA